MRVIWRYRWDVCGWATWFIVYGSAGCMSHEQGAQMHREIRELDKRVSDIEAGRNEPAPPEWQHYAGDGR